jgi:hypothetical protein
LGRCGAKQDRKKEMVHLPLRGEIFNPIPDLLPPLEAEGGQLSSARFFLAVEIVDRHLMASSAVEAPSKQLLLLLQCPNNNDVQTLSILQQSGDASRCSTLH